MNNNVYNTLSELLNNHHQIDIGKAKNIKGLLFGYAKPICRVENKSDLAYWACECKCGKFFIARAGHLISGRIKSCGCYKKEVQSIPKTFPPNHEKLEGRRFGHLVVVEYCGKDKVNHAIWKCQCDCGNFINVTATHLKTGHTRTCGCTKISKYEEFVKEWLENKGLSFKRETTVKELGRLRFDFRVLVDNKEMYIEVQGQQHFKPVDRFGGEKEFISRVENDKRKVEYCKKNNIPLLVINYYDNFEEKLENFFLAKKFND